jgi:hypothetical protein
MAKIGPVVSASECCTAALANRDEKQIQPECAACPSATDFLNAVAASHSGSYRSQAIQDQ